jgi:hypothetical protein
MLKLRIHESGNDVLSNVATEGFIHLVVSVSSLILFIIGIDNS